MPQQNQTEVLVVGAGPVGMMTALLAAQHGLRTTIIDQKSRTARHSYACALHPASLALLARAGILPDVIKLGLRVETVALFDGGALQTRLQLGDLPDGHPFAVVPGSPIIGGHDMLAVGYDPEYLYLVTWADTHRATWPFVARYCDEAFALITQSVKEKGFGPTGVDFKSLLADLPTI